MKPIFILSDLQQVRNNLLPLTYTRTVADLRVGIDTIAEKWQRYIADAAWYQEPEATYLNEFYSAIPDTDDRIYIAANIIPDADIANAVAALNSGDMLLDNDKNIIAYRSGNNKTELEYKGTTPRIEFLFDIFLLNGNTITADFDTLAKHNGKPVSDTCTIIGNPENVFIAKTATVEGAIINVKNGPVYIGDNSEVMEGALIRGPFALCEHATVNMGTKIYPGTTIGPWCKVGGELNNVVIQAYSNKAHDGFLGNAVIGEWCNIGAGTTASNLKNDYTPIRLWHYPTGRFMRTKLQFCGLIMGDHSKIGINAMLNTATVLGVGVNIHGSGFPRNFVPSFSEGSTAGFTEVPMNRFCDTAQRMMARRGIELTDAHTRMFEAIHNAADEFK